MKVPFFRHGLGRAELERLAKVLRGPILTTGAEVFEFERKFSKYLGIQDTVACTSWTGAAHIVLIALGVGPGDEVITTPFTFVASALAILQAGATPVFVDVELGTGNLDASLIEAAITRRTKAILPVHLYGQMADMKAIARIAKKHRLKVVEDAAHCVEGSRDGVRPGQLSDAVCFSFFATKNLACGEGGAVSFRDPSLSKKLRLLRLHGMTKTSYDREKEGFKPWDVEIFGWKYNMDNLHAALLLPQLGKIQKNAARRRERARWYKRGLQDIPEIELFPAVPRSVHAHHLYPILVPARHRGIILQKLREKGVETTVNYRPVHLLSYFRGQPRWSRASFPVAEKLGERVLSLPLYPGLGKKECDYVIRSLKRILQSLPAES